MYNIDEIVDRLRINEETAQKFFEVEVRILSTLHFTDLFERLLTEIREKFSIPYVWISLVDNSSVSHLIDEVAASEVVRERLNLIQETTLLSLVGNSGKPLLANKDLTPFYRLLPEGKTYLIRSLAIAPIVLDDHIIGSLNCADGSDLRYAQGMDTTLLERLAVKVSIALSNVTAHERIRLAASRDPVTGLLNRRAMDAVLTREFDRAKRYEHGLSILFLDLDDFKSINDRYGHDVGDAVLAYVSGLLQKMCRSSDVAARFGGDEILIILPSTPLEAARVLAERAKRHLQDHPFLVEGAEIPVSFSVGIADLWESGAADPAALIRFADGMLLTSKRDRKREDQVVDLPIGGQGGQKVKTDEMGKADCGTRKRK
jgi:diguanylate cyclase (GGDEF)-like protein